MTKADRIRELYATGLDVNAIAERVGCRSEYVRVCARQRANGLSRADKKYRHPNPERVRKLSSARGCAMFRVASQTGDREGAKKAGRVAYAKARANGANPKEAGVVAVRARNNHIYRTGDSDAMRRAGRQAAIDCKAQLDEGKAA